jgi:hypothetical protein
MPFQALTRLPNSNSHNILTVAKGATATASFSIARKALVDGQGFDRFVMSEAQRPARATSGAA